MGLKKTQWSPKKTIFDPFWQELQIHVHEFAAVAERRHSDILYLPVATSIENLCQIILDRLPEGSAAPSNSCLYMNFWPSHQYHNSASHHTGRFNLKFQLQQLLVRAQHPDTYYCATLFKFQRTMAVKYCEYASMFFVDDKAIVSVGEPGRHIVELLYQEIKYLVHFIMISISMAQLLPLFLKVMFLIM